MSSEKNAIEQVLKSFEEAWNKHDVDAFSLLFATDADFTNVFGIQSHGREAIKQFHAPLFISMFKSSLLTIIKTKTRFIRPDVASVDSNWKMSGATDPGGNPWTDRNGLMNLIMTADNGEWVITVMHNKDTPDLSR